MIRAEYLIPVLAALAQGDPLPLEEGASWTYTVEERAAGSRRASEEVTARVGASVDLAGERWTQVSNFLGYETCWLSVSAKALRLRLDTEDGSPSLTIVKFGARAGDSWKGDLGEAPIRITAGSSERLEFGGKTVETRRFDVLFEGHEGHAHPAPRGAFRFADGLGILEARLKTDLDCRSSGETVFRLKP